MNDFNQDLMKRTGLKQNQIPKVVKICLNVGVGTGQKEKLAFAQDLLWKITGQKPVITKARKSVAGFSIREGWPIGTKVTLRSKNMDKFQKKLINLILPAVRDFEGLSNKSFDGRGNYSFGIKDYSVFPEMPFDNKSHKVGIDVTIETSADSDDIAKILLDLVGYPFKETAKK